MESVVFDGKEYIKASVLAERFRYTQDYLGQLCRGKKVDARLVGRAWYINLDSLQSHRSARYKVQKDTNSTEISQKISSNNFLSRIDVEPVLKGKTVRIIKTTNDEQTEVAVKYEADDYSLIPKVNKVANTTWLPIRPADAEVLAVKEQRPITKFAPDPLPEVYLSGHISVEGIPEATEETVKEDVPEDMTNEVNIDSTTIKIKPEQGSEVQKPRLVSVKKITKRPASLPAATNLPVRDQATPVSPLIKRQVRAERDRSSDENERTITTRIPSSTKISPSTPTSHSRYKQPVASVFPVLIATFFLAGVCSLTILSLATEVLVLDSRYADRITIDTRNVSALVEHAFSR